MFNFIAEARLNHALQKERTTSAFPHQKEDLSESLSAQMSCQRRNLRFALFGNCSYYLEIAVRTQDFIQATIAKQDSSNYQFKLRQAMGCLRHSETVSPREALSTALRIWENTRQSGAYYNITMKCLVEPSIDQIAQIETPEVAIDHIGQEIKCYSCNPAAQLMLLQAASRILPAVQNPSEKTLKVIYGEFMDSALGLSTCCSPGHKPTVEMIVDAIGGAYFRLAATAVNIMGSAQVYSFISNVTDIAANKRTSYSTPSSETTQRIAAHGLAMYVEQAQRADTVSAAIDLVKNLEAFTKTVGGIADDSLTASAEIACQKLLPLIAREEGMNEAYDYAEKLKCIYASHQHKPCLPVLDFMAQNLEVLQRQAGMEIAIKHAASVGADHPDVIAFTSGHLEEIFYQAAGDERKALFSTQEPDSQPVQDFYQPLSDAFKAIAQPLLFRTQSTRKKEITVSLE